MIRECFLITSYCDSQEKLDVLIETIQDLKVYGFDICVHAHYPLPHSIQKEINYYIYDSSNPIIPYGTRSIIMWRKMDNLQLNILKRDYGYTVMNQIKGGLLFLHNLNYDVVHILNYDAIVTKQLMENTKKIENHSGVFYLNTEDEANLLFLTIKIQDYLSEIESISQQDYISMNEYWYAEGYVFHKFNKNNFYFHEKPKDKEIRHQPFEFLKFDSDKYSIHIGQKINWYGNEKVYTNKLSIYFYNVKEKLDFKLFLGFNLYAHKEISQNTLLDTDLDIQGVLQHLGYYRDNDFVEGDRNMSFIINGRKINKEIMDNVSLCAIEEMINE